jgi:hypothetical protein
MIVAVVVVMVVVVIVVVAVVVVVVVVVVVKSGNSLDVRTENMCIYKDTVYIIMRNVEVMIIIKSIYRNA